MLKSLVNIGFDVAVKQFLSTCVHDNFMFDPNTLVH